MAKEKSDQNDTPGAAAEIIEATPSGGDTKSAGDGEKSASPVVLKPSPILVDASSQQIVARDNTELVRMIQIFMKGVALPKTLDTQEKVITAWQAAASLRVPPIVAIQNMAIIHGSLSIWGQLPKGLAEATGQLEEFQIIYFDDKQDEICIGKKNLTSEVWGSVIKIRRSKRHMNEYFFTEPEAKKAGLLNKSGPWTDYRKIMYARRAMGQATKFEFPDAIMGLCIAEYDFNEAPDLRDVTRSERAERAKDLNSRFATPPPAIAPPKDQ